MTIYTKARVAFTWLFYFVLATPIMLPVYAAAGLLIDFFIGTGPWDKYREVNARWWEDAPIAKTDVGTSDVIDLWIEGPITSGETVNDFMRKASGKIVRVVMLDSDGGSLSEAIDLAYIISDHGIRTSIPEGAECASSCAIIFLAGSQRELYGRLGVHQFSPVNPETTVWDIQTAVSHISRIIEEFDAPISILTNMMATPPDKMFWYGPESASAFRRPFP